MQPTVTYGIISGVHRYQFPAGTLLEYADCLQTDASINPGNSGGPLFDAEGRLIGINGRGSFEKRGRVNVGAAYAISINQIKNFLGALRGGRIVDHATLGATASSDAGGRAVVADILETSDAYRRGLRLDDEIVSFAGRPISTANGFKNVLGILPKGWRVPLSYRRDGKRYDILVRLAGVHGEEELLEKAGGRPPKPPMPMPKPGDRSRRSRRPARTGRSRQATSTLRLRRPPNRPCRRSSKKHFVEKRGFANYYFNTLEQERVWKAWNAAANLGGGDWTLSGPLEKGGEFRLQITDAGASLKLPASEIEVDGGRQPRRVAAAGRQRRPVSRPLSLATTGRRRARPLRRRLLSRHGPLARPRRAGRRVGRLAQGRGMPILLRPRRTAACWRSSCLPTKTRIRARSISPTTARRTAASLPRRMEVRFGDEPFATFKIEAFKVEKSARRRGRKDAK